LLLAELDGEDCILCQITSQPVRDRDAISLAEHDFELGGLRQESNIRPNRLFTADRGLILYSAGRVRREKVAEVVDRAVEILRR